VNKKYKILFANIIVLSFVLIIILTGYLINPKLEFLNFNKGNSVINDISSYCQKLKNSSNKYIGSNQILLWEAKLNNAKDEYNIWFAKLGLAKAEMNLGGFDEAVSIIEETLNSGNFRIGIYLSSDETITTDDYLFASCVFDTGLSAKGTGSCGGSKKLDLI